MSPRRAVKRHPPVAARPGAGAMSLTHYALTEWWTPEGYYACLWSR